VVDYLVTVGGVDADRLEVDGRGETDLKVEPELTAEDKQRNRRIEWELLG
jgi:flagellar motor protein MotB